MKHVSALLSIMLLPAVVWADGALDTGFGTGGKVTTAIGAGSEQANAVVQQSDGKLVVGGYSYSGSNDDFALVRYQGDGSLDTGFGSAGKVVTPVGAGGERANALVLQADGKLVAAGYSNNGTNDDFALVRYNSDGTLDTGFGSSGKALTPVGSSADGINALIWQSDGKLVAAGYSNNGANNDFALVRYNSDGTLDTSFASGGKVTTAIGAGDDTPYAMLLQGDGKYVLAGRSTATTVDVALVRYNSNGSLDTTFGSGGKVITAVDAGGTKADEARAIVQQADGKLVIAGFACTVSGLGCNQNDILLIRYNANGSLDTAFGSGGKVLLSTSATTYVGSNVPDQALALRLQGDGKLIIAGVTYGSNLDFLVGRLTSSGSWDTAFGSNGRTATPVGSSTDIALAVVLQSDGNLLAAGLSSNGSNNDIALVRYQNAVDVDGDGVADASDNCPVVANSSQLDSDSDGNGDACDSDDDNDGVLDANDKFPQNSAASIDKDNDGQPDSWNQPNPYGCSVVESTCNGLTLDTDLDNDGMPDAVDNCPNEANADQADMDGDGMGDACDNDIDGDGSDNGTDHWPYDSRYTNDNDHDTLPDNWELAHGRDPSVSDYAISKNCFRDENGGVCAPSSGLYPVLIDIQTQSLPCPFLNTYYTELVPLSSGVDRRHTSSVYEVRFFPGPPSFYNCIGPTVSVTGVNIASADRLVQFSLVGANDRDFCFLDHRGQHCYADTGSGWAVAPATMLIDSDHDGMQRKDDPDDLDELNPWVDTDGDTVHNLQDLDDDNDGVPDYIDAAPQDAGNAAEALLPVDADYRGSVLSEQVSP